jgi:hypothetical protein
VTLRTGLAGCTGFGRADATPPTEDGGTQTPTETARQHGEGKRDSVDEGSPPADGPTETTETVVVPWQEPSKEDVRPHDLRVWNTVDRQRAVTVTVSPVEPDVLTGLTTSHHVPTNEAVAVELRQPATYRVSVQVDGVQVTTFELGEDWFDCNNSATVVELGADGAVDRAEVSTPLACDDATVETPTAGGS